MGKIADAINSMIKTALQNAAIASPRFSDYRVQEVLNTEDPDLETLITEILKKETKQVEKTQPQTDKKTKRDIQSNKEKLSLFEQGNVGDIQGMSTKQFGNIREFASNPFGFMVSTFLRKFRTGLGILFIVTIATEVIKFLTLELFKPGRPFDIRFREEIDKQVVKFLERKEQQELRQGFKSIITTTIGGLRGDALRDQTGGNFYTPDRIPPRFIDQSRISPPRITNQDARKRSFQSTGAAQARARQ